ncbi:D12 class N6 adenine-specific DNA methyltransferase [Methyloversatilis universalis FAM5]|uniref:D12 class N6 adenine-specific DNA methyltransferase n=2 Tax=Methyloversatilis universalis TaxID=378211 RepID=F5R872_METUF|nr:D12 class N6 adenine-specific DNA methyltransferase [Methyloversatilis universalis FAM5]
MDAVTSAINSPALRYHGGKFRLAQWVMQFFPPHQRYTEAFGGAAGVLLQKPRAYAEIYNDLDDEIVNFFRVLRDPVQCAQLLQALHFTPYARAEFDMSWTPAADPVEQARRTAVRAAMGFGSAGATKGSTGFRIDSKRAHGTAQMLWTRYPESVMAAAERMRGVLIEHRPAIEVLTQHDGLDALHFVDPPYVLDTRNMRASTRCYRYEMSDDDHLQLLHTLRQLKGAVVLSGYPHALYDDTLHDWARHTTSARISAGRGTGLRTECVWLNPQCARALAGKTGGLFA